MRNINDELRCAAGIGDEASLKSLLLYPKCNALANDACGGIALMYAAYKGHTSCIQLLLPVSDALAMNKHGKTARSLATESGHDATVSLIDAYALAMSEWSALHSSVTIGQPRRSKALRV